MNRTTLMLAVAALFLSTLVAQDRQQGTLPPGPAPGPTDSSLLVNALVVPANMIQGGTVMFLVQTPQTDPNKVVPPDTTVAVDGKAVRAFGVDRKPLDVPELNKRLALRTAAVVVHGQAPDPFFLKALGDRTVVFVVPKRLFDQMAKAEPAESLWGWWTVTSFDGKQPPHAADAWVIDDKKIAVRRAGKPDSTMTYTFSAADYPRTIDLTPTDGPAKGMTLKGIYDLDGNTLTVCHVAPTVAAPAKAARPKEMGVPGTVTVVFARVQP
jgi:uncharacterized protein (TIGR03067 family)